MEVDEGNRAAGGYRRTDGQLFRRSRSSSPARDTHFRGGTLFEASKATAEASSFSMLEAGGQPVGRRRIRSPSPPLPGHLRGVNVLEENVDSGKLQERGNHRDAVIVDTFNATSDRHRVRKGVAAEDGSRRMANPTWRAAEDFGPKAAEGSFPSHRGNLHPHEVMSQMLGAPVEGQHQQSDIFGSPRRHRGERSKAALLSGHDPSPRSPRCARINATNPITGLGELAAVAAAKLSTNGSTNGNTNGNQKLETRKFVDKVAGALAMESAMPIMWPGDDCGDCPVDSPSSAISPMSLRPRPVRKLGEFSPRRGKSPSIRERSPSPAADTMGEAFSGRAGDPVGIRSPQHGIPGKLVGKGSCSPRDQKVSLVVENQAKPGTGTMSRADFFLQTQRPQKSAVPDAPWTGGASAALQWRG